MNIITPVETDENKNLISDEQQSPIISTLEKREELAKENNEPTILLSTETIVPITINVDSKPVEELTESKIVCSSSFATTSTVLYRLAFSIDTNDICG